MFDRSVQAKENALSVESRVLYWPSKLAYFVALISLYAKLPKDLHFRYVIRIFLSAKTELPSGQKICPKKLNSAKNNAQRDK